MRAISKLMRSPPVLVRYRAVKGTVQVRRFLSKCMAKMKMVAVTAQAQEIIPSTRTRR